MKHLLRLAAFIPVLALSSCTGVTAPSQPAPSSSRPAAESTASAPPPSPQSAPPPAEAPRVEAAVAPATTTPPTARPVEPPAKPTPPPVAKAPAKAPEAPAPTAQPKKEVTPPEVAKPKPPPLDLAGLEERLKDTKAIGVLTKLTLKNQVDDLLSQFRAYYQGKVKTDLAALRRSYDLLILKVISLLQDSDKPLATALASSREAIWGILSDPAKFATI